MYSLFQSHVLFWTYAYTFVENKYDMVLILPKTALRTFQYRESLTLLYEGFVHKDSQSTIAVSNNRDLYHCTRKLRSVVCNNYTGQKHAKMLILLYIFSKKYCADKNDDNTI